jgi:hypothetical protein
MRKPDIAIITLVFFTGLIIFTSCAHEKSSREIKDELTNLDLTRGEVTLCGAESGQFGTVSFGLACSDQVRADFNLALALLHSFEYSEAEKVFVKVADNDPQCVMTYWGIAMSNFHPLWSPPDTSELVKGSRVIALARSLITDKTSRESDYIEAVAAIYDQWNVLDHKTRLAKFEIATHDIYQKYPEDDEAAVFYALALGAAADPKDKSFQKQRKAAEILKPIFLKKPNHPGVAHYLIHLYDYPEIASEGLSAARKYAAIASASAHAQHMPSHIFTRLGLWDESIQSNINSISAAQCYAEQSGLKGHWDEELHGLDYLIYAHLQKGEDEEAKRRLDYLNDIKEVSPINFKSAYSFAAGSARYAIERKDWDAAANVQLVPNSFPWEKFPWESANLNFARFLGAIHTKKVSLAKQELNNLELRYRLLLERKDSYKANLVLIQVKAAQAWLRYSEGDNTNALKLMEEAANMEEATAKHPVTPGEIIPARELLGDLYLAMKKYQEARREYEADLKKHPNKFNDLYGVGLASVRVGDRAKAAKYYEQLLILSDSSKSDRLQLRAARDYLSLAKK